MKPKKLLLLIIIPLLSFGQDKVLKDSLFCDGHPDKGSWYYQGKLFTGVAFQYYENGKKMGEDSYKNGFKHGDRLRWWPNGQLREVEPYIEGEITGICREYFHNGNLRSEGKMENGKEVGIHKAFDENGQLVWERYYYENIQSRYSQIRMEKSYNDGKLRWKVCWDEDGVEITCE